MTLRQALGLSAVLCAGLAQAQAPDALGWLRKIHDATHKLSYSGTFVYQNGTRSETSRITRFGDAGGDIEKVQVMDGVPREIVRTRDTVRCYSARQPRGESRAAVAAPASAASDPAARAHPRARAPLRHHGETPRASPASTAAR